MPTPSETLIDLETKFWRSIVDNDSDQALELLCEPSLMVSSYGAMKFDHKGYREMAAKGSMIVKSFELNDIDVVFPNETTAIVSYKVKQEVAARGKAETKTEELNDTSTWIQKDKRWQCVMHTETPAEAMPARH
ncbi:MAG TPA: nuclear transport factor 2 family protein [Steroidobacteraceae bacterium]|nr:nuclear transport factor 2 family protein [Steroidobacteraceae bacterium]